MLLVSVLGLCFGVSFLAVKLNYSVALGAFLIGAIIAEARQIHRIEALMEPVRDMFSAIFFVSIGLLINPVLIWQHAVPILIITVVVVVGQAITCSFGAFIAGNDKRTSLQVGMGLAQIGEFSFIIASLGLSLNVTSKFLYPIAVAVSGLTTLISPYLIKGSGKLVDLFDRKSPSFLNTYLDLYTRWVSQLGETGKHNVAFHLVRKLSWQIGLNVMLVIAVFLAAAFVEQRRLLPWQHLVGGDDTVKALLWLLAMVLSLPIFIAIFRKLQALAMLLAEVSVTRAAAGEQTQVLRSVLSNTMLTVSCGALLLLILLLSSTILPSRNVLIVLVLILIGGAILLRRSSVRIYAKAQVALRETLTQVPEPRYAALDRPMPRLLRDAMLRTIPITAGSPAAGRMIGELRIRSESGASVVGIQREPTSIINPGPDEDLRSGDELLLLGTTEQLDAASKLLASSAPGNEIAR